VKWITNNPFRDLLVGVAILLVALYTLLSNSSKYIWTGGFMVGGIVVLSALYRVAGMNRRLTLAILGVVGVSIVGCLALVFVGYLALNDYSGIMGVGPSSAATPIRPQPTAVAIPAWPTATMIRSPLNTATPILWDGYTPIAQRTLYVCAEVANVRSGPGTSYSVIKKLTSDWYVTVFGKIGQWYYIGYNERRVDQFMHQSVLCDAPLVSAPNATATWCVSTGWFDDCSVQPSPNPTPILSACKDYTYQPATIRDFPSRCPILGVTKPNRITVYYTSAEAEYYDFQGVNTVYFASAGEAEAAGYVAAHPK
jgi:hypothetical protein